MPFIGLTPFLQKNRRRNQVRFGCVSMPFIGLTPFLQILHQVLPSNIISVNALHRAYSISTIRCYHIQLCATSCQCPSSGLLHFYFEHSKSQSYRLRIVSMPFIGLTPFLPYIPDFVIETVNVSMPFIGLTPFLQRCHFYENR